MNAGEKRLRRLSRAQADLARLLELRISTEQRNAEELARARSGTAAALERMSTEGLAFYATALRRLAELDKAAAGSEAIRRDLMQRLLAVRSRQEALQRKADAQSSTEVRKMMAAENIETVAAMLEKATGKRDVLK